MFYRLCYVKLKLLLIAIEYKSEQRESRFVYATYFQLIALNCGKSGLLCDTFPPQILFAALITVYICIMINGIMLVNDICKIPCQNESPFQPYAYLVQFGF